MNLSNQIKELRKREGFSQEALAERIYVSRQTISNWETERSYPDVQSLLMLSVLFDVSLDELIKGDLEMMKKEVDAHKMNIGGWVMVGALVLGLVSSLPLYDHFGLIGIIPSLVLVAISLGAALVVEKIKKKHNVQTYSEILAFTEGKPVDEEKSRRERSRLKRTKVLQVLVSGLTGALFFLLVDWVYTTIFK